MPLFLYNGYNGSFSQTNKNPHILNLIVFLHIVIFDLLLVSEKLNKCPNELFPDNIFL